MATCERRGQVSHGMLSFTQQYHVPTLETKWKLHTYVHKNYVIDRHLVSAATHDECIHVQFTQLFTVIYSLHSPHLLLVQEVCPKGLTQLLH